MTYEMYLRELEMLLMFHTSHLEGIKAIRYRDGSKTGYPFTDFEKGLMDLWPRYLRAKERLDA